MFEFSPTFDLSNLNGKNGFAINGVAANDRSGVAVRTAGDVNGDGIADVIIGADGVSPRGHYSVGASYVVFGKETPWNTPLSLSALNGTNGFVIIGANTRDHTGFSVSTAGDINGDGIADVIIGAFGASPGGRYSAGSSYVVFGKKSNWNASLELSTLNGENGFVINGVTKGDVSGSSVSTAGDVNGDGIADIIIGADGASYLGADIASDGSNTAGSSYVIFGKKTAWNASLELSTLNGKNGFAIRGITADDFSGCSVSTAGDVNSDGIADVIIGAFGASPGQRKEAGSSYIVFGKKTAWNASLELSTLNGKNGFAINGVAAFDMSGNSLSNAGDVNGDGVDDIIIAASATSSDGYNFASSSYVVFGKRTPWDASLELAKLNGKDGFVINGVAESGNSGNSVSTAGDINGDGIADIIIGAQSVNEGIGASYVVFGKKTAWNTSLELSTLNGKNGFVIKGVAEDDFTGSSVSTAGDLNGDGIVDVVIGAQGTNIASGTSYVVFGESSGPGFFSHRTVAQPIEVSANLSLKP